MTGPLERFAPALAEYADRVLGLDDPVAATALVERLLPEARGWRADARANLAAACETLERATRRRRRTGLAERAIEAERSANGEHRAAAEALRIAVMSTWASHPANERALGVDHRCLDRAPADPVAERVETLRIDADHRDRCDVVVVGAGAAGSLVASRLAAAGLQVTVLEAGLAPGPGEAAGSPSMRMLRVSDALRFTEGTPVRLLAGSGPGGSTRGWFGSLERPSERVLDQWCRIWDEVDRPWCSRRLDSIERILQSGSIPDPMFGENANAAGTGAVKAGVGVRALNRAAPGCRGCGTCIAGCPTRALVNAADLMLPAAVRAGSLVIVEADVHTIVIQDGAAAGVIARGPDGAVIHIEAREVVLAGGVTSTATLLERNALGVRSGTLGAGISLQPAIWVAGGFEGALRGWVGVPQTLAFDGPPGIRLRATAFPPDLAAALLPGTGVGARRTIQSVEQLAGITVQVDDADARIAAGRITWSPSEQTMDRLAEGIASTASILFEAGARSVVSGIVGMAPARSLEQVRAALDGLDQKTALRLIAYDMTGGVTVGADPVGAVVASDGSVHGVAHLSVADASTIPTSPGVAPLLSVLLNASRVADRVASGAADL